MSNSGTSLATSLGSVDGHTPPTSWNVDRWRDVETGMVAKGGAMTADGLDGGNLLL